MINTKRYNFSLLIIASLSLLLFLTSAASASFYYEILEQKEQLFVRKDGIVDLTKEFIFKVSPTSTESCTTLWVGLPTEKTTVHSVESTVGGQVSPVRFRVGMHKNEPRLTIKNIQIAPGEERRFAFSATISNLMDIRWHNSPLSFVTLYYKSAWWDAAEAQFLQVKVTFEDDAIIEHLVNFSVNPDTIETIDGRKHLVWESDSEVEFTIPQYYFLLKPVKQVTLSPDVLMPIIRVVMLALFILLIYLIYKVFRRKMNGYTIPLAYSTGTEAQTTFDPVETAMFFDQSIDFIAKLIIIGLVQKGVVKIKEGGQMHKNKTQKELTWYEELFLASVSDNVEIIYNHWKKNHENMIEHFKELITGYCPGKTHAYYQHMLENTVFTAADDQRWIVVQGQLINKLFKTKQTAQGLKQALPETLAPFIPLFMATVIREVPLHTQNPLSKSTGFRTAGGSHGGGGGCACACACACASSGGCT